METSTNVTEATTVTTPSESVQISQKFVDYLLRTAAEQTGSPEEVLRSVIEQTWERATTPSTRPLSAKALVENSVAASKALSERLNVAVTVAQQTAAKLTFELPADLQWANTHPSSEATVLGVFKPEVVRPHWGKEYQPQYGVHYDALGETDVVRFTVGSKEGQIPLSLLNNDPMAVSQYIRKAARTNVENKIREETYAIEQERKRLERDIVTYEKTAAARRVELQQQLEKQSVRKIKPASKDKVRTPKPANV